jgi:hypothetical protein
VPKVPGAEAAFIEEAKLRDYLLDVNHPDGGPKAAFFIGFGFRRDQPDALGQAILEHLQTHDAEEVATDFGKRYIVDAPIRTPSGRAPWVRTVWEVKDGPPRLITAIPAQAKS